MLNSWIRIWQHISRVMYATDGNLSYTSRSLSLSHPSLSFRMSVRIEATSALSVFVVAILAIATKGYVELGLVGKNRFKVGIPAYLNPNLEFRFDIGAGCSNEWRSQLVDPRGNGIGIEYESSGTSFLLHQYSPRGSPFHPIQSRAAWLAFSRRH